jgi:hypothetical protein
VVEPANRYEHTQIGPWSTILGLCGVLLGIIAWFVRYDPVACMITAGVALIMGLLAPCFHRLTVCEEADRFVIRFGPLSLFKTSIRFVDIRHVEIGRTWLIEGWGIHQLTPSRGVVWNIWGRDCVVVRHRKTIRIGTNEPEALLMAIQSRLAESNAGIHLPGGRASGSEVDRSNHEPSR